MGWDRRGEPVLWVIANMAELYEAIAPAIVSYLSGRHGYRAFQGGYGSPYGCEACYEVIALKNG